MACDELRPYMRRELGWPLNELGRIRLHKADSWARRKHSWRLIHAGWDPQPGLALVQLARGDVAARGDLRTRRPRSPLAGAVQGAPTEHRLATRAAARGTGRDRDRSRRYRPGRSATDELEVIAARFESKALVAGAAVARGRVRLADGDVAGAEQSLSEAVRLWNEVGAPYEAAIARLDLAEAHRANGSEHRAMLESQAVRTILAGIQAAPTLAPAVTPPLDDTRDEQPIASSNVFRREGDYWSVIFEGHTVHVRDLKGMRYLAGSSPIRAGSTTCSTSRRRAASVA